MVKGLKPEQADEVPASIQTRLLRTDRVVHGRRPKPTCRPAARPPTRHRPRTPTLAAPSPDAVANAAGRLAILNRDRLNEADLLRKLADLHRAGVLSDAEFEEKIALVGRLGRARPS